MRYLRTPIASAGVVPLRGGAENPMDDEFDDELPPGAAPLAVLGFNGPLGPAGLRVGVGLLLAGHGRRDRL